MMGAVTPVSVYGDPGQDRSGQGAPRTRAPGGRKGKWKLHEPSLFRVHARDICAMLKLRFLASSSTLAGGKEGGHVVSYCTDKDKGRPLTA